jgi:ribosome-associated heat shock protein Hsp15
VIVTTCVCEAAQVDTTRVDRWLWAVRLCKTRTDAIAACRAGHVRIDGKPAKPASPVTIGRMVRARVAGRERVVEVARVIDKRVGAAIAAECYVDRSPPPPPREASGTVAVRVAGSGRPTKRDRRRLERLRHDGPPDLPFLDVADEP